ncbi:PaaI family thioesterase [Reyranella sp. CPCC 100927]|uniref:PaaI family thioesterase n=1 Tax=Reyranella sp. CPCC 100927 TaxID=2599616 RepID=UPI0011B82411|nr:PaaI family thioesterase [Reyranella sp. CPCC 100927]TWT14031.1 PaaI family thioesterase [Reyranella sp. CPCC 100927]
MTEDELQGLIAAILPAIDQHGVVVEEAQDQDVRLRFPFRPALLGPGDIFSGPALLGFADTAIFAAVLAASSGRSLGMVATMTTTFLRPMPATDVVAIARVIRRGKRMAHAEAWLFDHTPVEAVLHATASLVLTPRAT